MQAIPQTNIMKNQAALLGAQAQMYPQIQGANIQQVMAQAIANQVHAAAESARLNAMQQSGLQPGFTPNYGMIQYQGAQQGQQQPGQQQGQGPVGSYGQQAGGPQPIPQSADMLPRTQAPKGSILGQLQANSQFPGVAPGTMVPTINGQPTPETYGQVNNYQQGLNGQQTGQQQGDYLNQPQGPNPSKREMVVNQALYGSAITPQEHDQINQYQKLTSDANQQAQAAAQFQNQMGRWQELYNQTPLYTGQLGGKIATTKDSISGALAGLTDRGQYSNAQAMDKLTSDMVSTKSVLENTGQLRGPEISFLQSSKFDRTLNPQAVHDMSDFSNAVSDRTKAMANFYATGQQLNVPSQAIQRLANNFFTQRPIATKDGIQYANLGTEKDYLTPQAIKTAESGQDYTPPNQSQVTDLNNLKMPTFSNRQEFLNWQSNLKQNYPGLYQKFADKHGSGG
jgi:hypothetical protein